MSVWNALSTGVAGITGGFSTEKSSLTEAHLHAALSGARKHQEFVKQQVKHLAGQRVRVWLNDSRVFVGVLHSIDEHDTWILEGATEDVARDARGRRQLQSTPSAGVDDYGNLILSHEEVLAVSKVETEKHLKSDYVDGFVDSSDPPKIFNVHCACVDIARRMASGLDACLRRRRPCRLLVCGGAGNGCVTGLLLCMNALDHFLKLHHHYDHREIRKLITISGWIADFCGELSDWSWPEELNKKSVDKKGFLATYQEQLGVKVDLGVCGPQHGLELFDVIRDFESVLRGDRDGGAGGDVVMVLVVEAGMELFLDVQDPFRSGALNSTILVNVLERCVPTHVPLVYSQLEVQDSFRNLPHDCHFHSLCQLDVHNMHWQTDILIAGQIQELQQWISAEKEKARMFHMPWNEYMHHRLHGNRHDAFMLHCFDRGWIEFIDELPMVLKLEFAEVAGGVQRVPPTCMVATLQRNGPCIHSWNRLVAAVPEFQAAEMTYPMLMVALCRSRLQGVSQPPQCSQLENAHSPFAQTLLRQLSHAWSIFSRLRDSVDELQSFLRSASGDEMRGFFSVDIPPTFPLAGHRGIYGHFLGKDNGLIFDILLWLIMSESSLDTMSVLLSWAGILASSDLARSTLASVMDGSLLEEDSSHPDTAFVYQALSNSFFQRGPKPAISRLMKTHGRGPVLNPAVSRANGGELSRGAPLSIATMPSPMDTGFDNTVARETLDAMSDHVNKLMAALTRQSAAPSPLSTLNVGQRSGRQDMESSNALASLTLRSMQDSEQQQVAQSAPQKPPSKSQRLYDQHSEIREPRVSSTNEIDNALSLATAIRSTPSKQAPASGKATTNVDVSLPSGWEMAWSEQHKRKYYFNRSTGERSWRRPAAP